MRWNDIPESEFEDLDPPICTECKKPVGLGARRVKESYYCGECYRLAVARKLQRPVKQEFIGDVEAMQLVNMWLDAYLEKQKQATPPLDSPYKADNV